MSKPKSHWWHLVINYGPGRQSQYNEWQFISDKDAEDWKDEKYSELADWDQPAVVKVLEKGSPPKEVLREVEERKLRQFLYTVDTYGYLIIPWKKAPNLFKVVVPEGVDCFLVAKRSWHKAAEKIVSESESLCMGYSDYIKKFKVYVWY